jgi:hypothetical protein
MGDGAKKGMAAPTVVHGGGNGGRQSGVADSVKGRGAARSKRGGRKVVMGNWLGSGLGDKAAMARESHGALLPVCRPAGDGTWRKMTDTWGPCV